ncbi:MFS general substrate transporter [Aspergillus sclerotioniger CBS 115572]|uniref:MFS general substrate transporter n=1 Tax=Aspergillus sclerotioniger CBS 115572 TaxID=1450535 RepID=A0A317UW66_9EURO|nr:MFS general substrate transporter [Aspergillus sclerotioniger CBS 115572]PWY65659.1 MFS general substrate transporter [Aspergillus sclerotioniger CBS 115572]
METLKSVRKWAGVRHNAVAWLAFCIGIFCCTFSLLVPYDYLPSMANQAGMNLDLAQYTLSITNAESMIGRIVPGFLSDYMGQFNIMVLVSAFSAVAQLAIWLPVYYAPTNAGFIFFAAFYGFVSGGYTSLLSPCVVALVDGRVADLGLKFGVACLYLAFGALVGIPASGALVDDSENWESLIALSGSIMAVGALCFVVARVKKGGWDVMKKV